MDIRRRCSTSESSPSQGRAQRDHGGPGGRAREGAAGGGPRPAGHARASRARGRVPEPMETVPRVAR
eukprot:9435741-Lingulodinium_polyedra.AAC.1